MPPREALLERGIKLDPSLFQVAPIVELFGHVTLVEGYDLSTYIGCHALVALRDTPGKTVAVMTTEIRLQSLLETALSTGSAGRRRSRPLAGRPARAAATGSYHAGADIGSGRLPVVHERLRRLQEIQDKL